jgi:hypothetical protein
MAISKRFLPPIPENHQILWGDVEVAGVQHHRADTVAFIKGNDPRLEIAPERGNRHDPNAIVVFGITKGFFGSKKRKIGYVPAEISKAIAEESLFSALNPRLRNIYLSDDGFCIVQFDIVGPKSKVRAIKVKDAKSNVESAIQDGDFVIPRSNVEKNHLGMSCESTGDIDHAILCYEACIRNSFDGSHPYDRLIAIYRKLKRPPDELRIIKKAVRVFEKANSGRPDAHPNLKKYQEQLHKFGSV